MDAFLYPVPGPDASCLRECVEEWVHDEADGFLSETVPDLLRIGYLTKMTLMSDSVIHAGGEATTGRHLAFTVADDHGKRGRSDYLVIGRDGYRIKIRSTRFGSDSNGSRALSFFRDVAGGVQPAYRCVRGPALNTRTIQLETTVGVAVERLAPAIDSVLIEAGYEAKSLNGAWTSVPRFDWPVAIPASERAGGSPGYQVYVSVVPRADSTTYAIAVPAVCATGDDRRSDRTQQAMQAVVAMKVQVAIGKAVEHLP